jgi:hypothetical protein
VAAADAARDGSVWRQHQLRTITTACLSITAAVSAHAQILYVDEGATGAGDGSTWCDAFTHLQDALSVAADAGGAIHEIRVAHGVYKPDEGAFQTPLDRSATFTLISGVALKGGYAGCGAADPENRDTAAHQTVLSGDLAGNDVGERWDPSRHDNSYHVVSSAGTDATAMLDGFFIISGRADGDPPNDSGAGLHNQRGRPTLMDCTFYGHWALARGGAAYNTKQSHTTVTRCSFRENSADYGGAIANDLGSSPVLTDCVLSGNTVGYHGGAVYNDSTSAPTLMGCLLSGNVAYYNGGAMCNTGDSTPLLHNCLVTNNEARNGGGLHDGGGAAAVLVHCTLTANTARFGGGGLLEDNVTARLTSCILWGNTHGGSTGEPAQIQTLGSSLPLISHGCIQGWTGDLGGDRNMGDDPLFVPGPAGSYYLSQIAAGQRVDSPCVDTGSGTAGEAELNTRTTQATEAGDTGTVDRGYHYAVTHRPLVMGDFDRSGVVDPPDLAARIDCAAGPRSTDLSPPCRIFDFDTDGDCDLYDFSGFQRNWMIQP